MRKKAITKPEFRKIFIVRFLIFAVIFSVAAGNALSELYDHVLKSEVYESTNSYRDKIRESAEALSKAEPGSDEYKYTLNNLICRLTFYQIVGYNYAEVEVGGLKLATDKDTAFFWKIRDDKKDDLEYFFIEDISYLKPLEEYLKNNCIEDDRQITDHWYRYERDPLYEMLFPDHDVYFYSIKSVYVNRKEHTFIPGVIKIVDVKNEIEKEYLVDCTPADTKGYELVEYDQEDERQLVTAYRVAPGLSGKDIYDHTVPVVGGGQISYDDKTYWIIEDGGYEIDKSWHVGFSDYRKDSVFVIAPLSSALIFITDLAAAATAALVLSVVKYQRDRTVWEIFDYRVKTTEAMAHDLKTPLSTIMIYLENLEQDSKDPAKVLEYKNNINDKVVTMDHMIGDILLLSKSESGKVELSKEKVSVKEVVAECMKEFPELKTEIKGEDITIDTDRKAFSQVIMNLLSNCDRYGKKGSVVDITLAADILTVINKTDRTYDDAESLKKPFVKGDDHRGNKGSGVGLAIADNNLAMMGYKLELSSASGEFIAKIKFKS